MSYSESERKHDLECLRLASNLMEMGKSDLSPQLKAHCIRMAKEWSDRASQGQPGTALRS